MVLSIAQTTVGNAMLCKMHPTASILVQRQDIANTSRKTLQKKLNATHTFALWNSALAGPDGTIWKQANRLSVVVSRLGEQ